MTGIWRDIRWAITAFRAKRLRHRLGFAARLRFDDELRPKVRAGVRIAYPDADYHITRQDFSRATAGLNELMFDR